MAGLLLDITLTVLLLLMGWGALHSRTIGASIAMFVAFGLVLALTWARLGAPDLALAEAAIGAGLTGVLLLQAVSGRQPPPAPNVSLREHGASMALIGLAFLLLTAAVLSGPDALPRQQAALPDLVAENIGASGVSHPVTAVLLNFRAWDTLLEVLVLLVALLGFRQLLSGNPAVQAAGASTPTPWPLLKAWARILAPLLVVTGGYLLWAGATAPGGAFQAGAMLAAALVILRLSGLLPSLRWSWWPVRVAVTGGALLFLGIAMLTGFAGAGWLVYPQDSANVLIVVIEVVATLSIAATLSLLVIGDREDMVE